MSSNEKFYSAEGTVQIIVSLLKQYGIRRVIASPGTTNLTFVASLQQDPFFTVWSAPEERSAAYMAVGMAEESGEPVVITCTGATASRNYLPAMTEAFYRKLPVIAITATQTAHIVGQLVPQVIDRSEIQNDAAHYACHLPLVKDHADAQFVTIKMNEALHSLRKEGGGPVHVNYETAYNMDFSVKELPTAHKIDFYQVFDALPEIPQGKVGIFVGSHPAMDDDLTAAIDAFCATYDACVFCDHTSNYKGRYRCQYPIMLSQDNWHTPLGSLDLMIHIGGVSGAYAQPGGKRTWRVNPDGIIRTPYGLISAVFQMREVDFFRHYGGDARKDAGSFADRCNLEVQAIRKEIPVDLPFSNIWVAQQMSAKIPQGSVMHFGILNSLRSWNFFEVPLSVNSYSNVGGFGIDGPSSTIIGGALAQPDRLHYLVVGDLAFFYDLNSLGNRHLPANLRILLVNNGRGTEFTNYNHPAYRFGERANDYMAAGGHYGKQSPDLVRHYAEDLGFKYVSASSKEEVLSHMDEFLSPESSDTPLLLEVFTDSALENEALHIVRNLRTDPGSVLENKIRKAIGPKGVAAVKKILGK